MLFYTVGADNDDEDNDADNDSDDDKAGVSPSRQRVDSPPMLPALPDHLLSLIQRWF